jgi:hypothetical protein
MRLKLVECLFSYSGSFGKISPACRGNSPQVRVANSSSRNAVSFSSACTTKRLPSSRCASATKIVRPSRSTVATQPQLHPALLRLSAMIPITSRGGNQRCRRYMLKPPTSIIAELDTSSPMPRRFAEGWSAFFKSTKLISAFLI